MITIDAKYAEGLNERPVACRAEITDSLGRTVSKAVADILVTAKRKVPAVSANLEFDDFTHDGSLLGLNVDLDSIDADDRTCSVSIFGDSQLLMDRTYNLAAGESLGEHINIKVDPKTSNRAFKAMVTCEGSKLANATKEIVVGRQPGPIGSVSSKHIYADSRFDTVIDTNRQADGLVTIGVLGIRNSHSTAEQVRWSIGLDGETIDSSNMMVDSDSKEDVPIAVPVKMLSKDDTYSATVRCSLFDSDSKVILDRVGQITVRSRFDLDLRKLRELTAKKVDPLNPDVKHFVDTNGGPLSEAMGDRYIVSGYMVENAIIPQLAAVYNAIRDLGMAYVSDTSTLVKEGYYQRVRDPSAVLRDRSGNCIELSILMASIYESMEFEPIIVFPEGHAIVGVVMGTNAYKSKSVQPEEAEGAVVRLGNDEGYVNALFIESTSVADKNCTFGDSVLTAKKEVIDEIDYIMSNKMYSIISALRKRV